MRIKMYLHGSKESGYEAGKKLKLKKAALEKFMYALYEVEFELEVETDGSYKILFVDGRQLAPK